MSSLSLSSAAFLVPTLVSLALFAAEAFRVGSWQRHMACGECRDAEESLPLPQWAVIIKYSMPLVAGISYSAIHICCACNFCSPLQAWEDLRSGSLWALSSFVSPGKKKLGRRYRGRPLPSAPPSNENLHLANRNLQQVQRSQQQVAAHLGGLKSVPNIYSGDG